MVSFALFLVVERPLATTTSHFCRAADNVTQSAASFAVNWTMPLASITTIEIQQQNLLMASQPGQKSSMGPSVARTAKKFASTSTSVEPSLSALIPKAPECSFAPTAGPNPTTHLHGSAGHVLYGHLTAIDLSPLLTTSQFLSYHDFSNNIIHQDSLITSDTDFFKHSSNIYLRIVHPYDTDTFHHFISKHDLTPFYSLLVTNLRNGFPLGEMPVITDTVIFKNHLSATLHSDVIDKYLTLAVCQDPSHVTMLKTSCVALFSAPHSLFLSRPNNLAHQTNFEFVDTCQKETRTWLPQILIFTKNLKEDFPTHFDTALKVADIVCHILPTSDDPILFHGSHFWWAHSFNGSPLVTFLFMGLTSGDPSFMSSLLVARYFLGSTSGSPMLHEFMSGGLLLHTWLLHLSIISLPSRLLALIYQMHSLISTHFYLGCECPFWHSSLYF